MKKTARPVPENQPSALTKHNTSTITSPALELTVVALLALMTFALREVVQ